jgi:hypothetical protein
MKISGLTPYGGPLNGSEQVPANKAGTKRISAAAIAALGGAPGPPGGDLSQVGTIAQAQLVNILGVQPQAKVVRLTDRPGRWLLASYAWDFTLPPLSPGNETFTWFADSADNIWFYWPEDGVCNMAALGVVSDAEAVSGLWTGTDNGPAFLAALNAFEAIKWPRGKFLINGSALLDDNHSVDLGGSLLAHGTDADAMLRINGKAACSIRNGLLAGTLLSSGGDTGESAIHATNAPLLSLNNLRIKGFKGDGLLLDGSDTGLYRGDQGRISEIVIDQNTRAMRCLGTAGEYHVFSDLLVHNNVSGIGQASGNSSYSNTVIVDNSGIGFELLDGPNDGHGSFVGGKISHNGGNGFEANNILSGFDIVGTDIYENPVSILNCSGIKFSSGNIAAPIVIGLGANSGPTMFQSVYFPEDYGAVSITGSGVKTAYVANCHDPHGPSPLNDPASVYILATRGGGAQALGAGTTVLLYNNPVRDNRDIWDDVNGRALITVPGVYRVKPGGIVEGAGLQLGYVAVRKNGVDVDYVPVNPDAESDMAFISGGFVDVQAGAGDYIDCAITMTGVGKTFANGSQLSITLLG